MKKHRYRPWIIGSVLLLSLLLSGWLLYGCGGGVNMTHQQAADQADHLVNEVVGILHPRPGLELIEGLSLDLNCETALGNSSQVTVSRTYEFRGITVSDHVAIGKQVLAYWQKEGYTITRSGGIGTEQPSIEAQTSDGFEIGMEPGGDGLLTLGATSPCVQPAPTPAG